MVKILIKNAHICDPATNMDCEGDIFLVDGVIADIGTNLEYETEVRRQWVNCCSRFGRYACTFTRPGSD